MQTKKIVFKNSKHKITVEVRVCDGRLSIVAEHAEKSGKPGSTFKCHSCGQIMGDLRREFGDDPKAKSILEVWDRWHLNDLRAGNEAQESFLRSLPKDPNGRGYERACELLRDAGLYTHNGYTYGSGWIAEPLPQYVLDTIASW